jgi:hypothetical protein
MRAIVLAGLATDVLANPQLVELGVAPRRRASAASG